MKFNKNLFDDLVILEPEKFFDNRGVFFESFNSKLFNKNIKNINFVQDNLSVSKKGVFRGFHFQNPPFEQSKLVTCIEGKIIDFAIDLRKNSLNFGKYFSIELSSVNNKQIFIPYGFAHGFLTLSETAIVQYKVDEFYNKNFESGISYKDSSLNLDFNKYDLDLIISKKDENLLLLSEIELLF